MAEMQKCLHVAQSHGLCLDESHRHECALEAIYNNNKLTCCSPQTRTSTHFVLQLFLNFTAFLTDKNLMAILLIAINQ